MIERKKIPLKIIGLSSENAKTDSYVLVLGEENGKRRFPIAIGILEAQAIAMELEKFIPSRPMTHDLFKIFVFTFKIKIKEIYISELRDGVFFSKIICLHNRKEYQIDARPSDAIAIALRLNKNIYINEEILKEVGVSMEDYLEKVSDIIEKELNKVKKITKKQPIEKLTIEELKRMLKKTIEKEDYEKAALIRDEINKKNKRKK